MRGSLARSSAALVRAPSNGPVASAAHQRIIGCLGTFHPYGSSTTQAEPDRAAPRPGQEAPGRRQDAPGSPEPLPPVARGAKHEEKRI